MANVYDVANFFLDIVQSNEDDFITNLKLNKLMYFAQGCYLARTGKPLFADHIVAWRLGPVVLNIYHKYKVCGNAPIQTVDEEYSSDVFSTDELSTLIDVMREYGRYTGSTLVDFTHRANTPWYITFNENLNRIPEPLIESYFRENPVPAFDASGFPTVTELPKEWYDPEEDAEWEAYPVDK